MTEENKDLMGTDIQDEEDEVEGHSSDPGYGRNSSDPGYGRNASDPNSRVTDPFFNASDPGE